MTLKLITALLVVGQLSFIFGQRDTVQITIKRNGDCFHRANDGDTVDVHYTGRFTNGQIFDSSLNRGNAFKFALGAGQVIAGWDEGIRGMCVGERRYLVVPSHLAYGSNGVSGVIPPDSILTFDVELMKVHKKAAPAISKPTASFNPTFQQNANPPDPAPATNQNAIRSIDQSQLSALLGSNAQISLAGQSQLAAALGSNPNIAIAGQSPNGALLSSTLAQVPGLTGPPPAKSTKNTIQVQTVVKPASCPKSVTTAAEVVKVHYTGYHYVNKLVKFETSKGNRPYEVQLGTGDVIPGWEGGLQGMCIGEHRRLVIPPKLAYGAEGKAPHVPPNATLVYEVELMGIRPGKN